MATIELRSIVSRRLHKDESLNSFNKEKIYPMGDWAYGYCQGATEQRQIDTERVYHALEKVLSKEMLDNVRKILEE